MTRLFEDFGQQAVFEALMARGATEREARAAADNVPPWTSEKWKSLEQHIEASAKAVRVGMDAEHTTLLRRRGELEREMSTLEDAISAIEARLQEEAA